MNSKKQDRAQQIGANLVEMSLLILMITFIGTGATKLTGINAKNAYIEIKTQLGGGTDGAIGGECPDGYIRVMTTDGITCVNDNE